MSDNLPPEFSPVSVSRMNFPDRSDPADLAAYKERYRIMIAESIVIGGGSIPEVSEFNDAYAKEHETHEEWEKSLSKWVIFE